MTNFDTKQQKQLEIRQEIADAIRENDEKKIVSAFEAYGAMVSEEILAKVNGRLDVTDETTVLASRGVRQLTREEREYYQKFAAAAGGSDPKQALTMIPEAFPTTVINEVLDDVRTEHPLLDAIDFKNTTAITKWLLNTSGVQMATWGPLTSEITKELEGGFKILDMTMLKLSAYFPVAQDILDLGPVWIDVYIRSILQEALLVALEVGIVDGDGNNTPIGMTRNVSDDVTVTGGVYPRKTEIAVTDLSPKTYGALLSVLATHPSGKARTVDKVVMLVNPADYFKVVFPATTLQTINGSYVKDVLPYPTEIIQSVGVPKNKAVLGMPRYYFMGMGTAKNGKIEYSDDYRFLEDLRVYKIKLLGNGRAKDDNAFLLLDISGLASTIPTINTNVLSQPTINTNVLSQPAQSAGG